MNGYRFRGTQGTYKPRSQAGLGVGSHSSIQGLVGRLIQPVQIADERMDFVQGWQIDACLAAGRGRHACVIAASGRQGVASRVRKSIPLPPAPSVLRMGAIPKFSLLFPWELFPTFSTTIM